MNGWFVAAVILYSLAAICFVRYGIGVRAERRLDDRPVVNVRTQLRRTNAESWVGLKKFHYTLGCVCLALAVVATVIAAVIAVV